MALNVNQAAAEYLASAMLRISPKIIPIKGKAFNQGFFYDFVSKENLCQVDLAHIEEVLRQMISKEKAARYEMLGENAAELLKSKGEKKKAKEAEEYKGQLIFLFQLGDFFDLCEGDFIADFHSFFFSLTSCEFLGNDLYRLIGYASSDKAELKKRIKNSKTGRKNSHVSLGEKLDLFSFRGEQLIWSNRGENFYHQLESYWRKFRISAGFSKESQKRIAQCQMAKQAKTPFPYPSLFHLSLEKKDRLAIFCEKKEIDQEGERLKSHIEDFHQFLGLTIQENNMRWSFIDSFGENHLLSFMRLRSLKNQTYLWEGSLLYSVERLMGCLCEQYEGNFPLWLAPEHMRMLPAKENFQLDQLQKQLLLKNFSVGMDRSSKSLKEKIQKAQKELVPFLMIVSEGQGSCSIQDKNGRKREMPLSEVEAWLAGEIKKS